MDETRNNLVEKQSEEIDAVIERPQIEEVVPQPTDENVTTVRFEIVQ